MNVIGDKQFATLSDADQKRTLNARFAVSSSDDRIVLTVSFDDAVTGKTGASITGSAKGDLFNGDERAEAFESVSKTLIKALEKDKGLAISTDK